LKSGGKSIRYGSAIEFLFRSHYLDHHVIIPGAWAMPTIYGVFQDEGAGKAAMQSIHHERFKNLGVQLVTKSDKHQLEALKKNLKSGEFDYYSGRVKDGASLLVVEAENDQVRQVTDLLRKHGMKEERMPGIAPQVQDLKEGEYILHVVQESLEVGKREVERGRVRLRSKVIEDAVEKEIGLRGETIRVHRRANERPVTEADRELFRELLIEVIEHDEEPVVTKTAKIVGEVVVTKEIAEKMHKVRDKVRRVDVEVEEIRGDGLPNGRVKEFHGYYDHDLAWTRRPFEEFVPAFTFGLELAGDDRFRSKNWNEIEQGARKYWDENHQGTWEIYHAAIRHAFEKGRG
jgi:stress response protein YsnF